MRRFPWQSLWGASWRTALLVFAVVLIGACFICGCGPSREDAAKEANEACRTHGGVNTTSQNGFFYTDDSEGEWNVTCADGQVFAGS